MTVPANTFDTYEQIGRREDLSDIIYDITPTETPFMSNAGKGKATSTYHEWQTDTFVPAAANAQVEGDDTTAQLAGATERFANYTQILKRSARVSGTAQSVNTAGRANDLQYQLAKQSKALKRDLEISLLGGQAAVAGDATTARELAGFATWCWTNATIIDSAGTPSVVDDPGVGAPDTDVVVGDNPVAVDEDDLKANVKSCWDNGGMPDMVLCGSFNKQAISAFTGIAEQRFNVNGNAPTTIIGAADIYVSDFGNLTIVPSRDVVASNIYVIQSDCVSVDYLRGFQSEELAKTGDSDVTQILCEATLRVDAPTANGVILTTTTS